MSLTELENLHKRISEMSISEFEDWLDVIREEAVQEYRADDVYNWGDSE